MGPGPCNPYPEVIEAYARPVLGHLDPDFITLMDEVGDRLRTVFQTRNQLTFAVSGTGSAGMEAAFVNFVGPGDTVVIGVNGVFGGRMCDVAARCGADVVRVDAPWGTPIDPQALLDAHPAPKLIAVVHAETSTGVRNDLATLGANKGDALLLADCVTSLGGIDLRIDEWDVDIAYSGTQKCLGVPPGLAPLTVSDRALAHLRATPQSWYLDLNMIAKYVTGGGGRTTTRPRSRACTGCTPGSGRCSRRGSSRASLGTSRRATRCRRGWSSAGSACSRRRATVCRSSRRCGCPRSGCRPA